MGFEPGTDLRGGVSGRVVEDPVQGMAAIAAAKKFEEAQEVRAVCRSEHSPTTFPEVTSRAA
jgi:hypothetical protein